MSVDKRIEMCVAMKRNQRQKIIMARIRERIDLEKQKSGKDKLAFYSPMAVNRMKMIRSI